MKLLGEVSACLSSAMSLFVIVFLCQKVTGKLTSGWAMAHLSVAMSVCPCVLVSLCVCLV